MLCKIPTQKRKRFWNIFVIFYFIFSGILAKCQNLIPDSSFEVIKKCPARTDIFFYLNFNELKYWNITFQSPDYFHGCTKEILEGRKQISQDGKWGSYFWYPPHSGKAFVGILLNMCNPPPEKCYDYFETFTTKLSMPMVKDSIYLISSFVRPGFQSYYPTLPVYLSDTFPENITFNCCTITELFPDSGFTLDDPHKWVRVSSLYKAKGNENYFTIGTTTYEYKSHIKKSTICTAEKKYSYGVYFYIDDVSVIPFYSYKVGSNELKTDSEYILNNLFFDSDKSVLLPQSFREIDSLKNYLLNNMKLNIQINGFTDDSGTEKHNLDLSTARAKAVADYLISKGIALSRINYEGLGSAKPVADNSTEEGRSKNRRVEFILIEGK